MSNLFFRNSSHAVHATKAELLVELEKKRNVISKSGQPIELLAIHNLYRHSCICKNTNDNQLHHYLINDDGIIKKENPMHSYEGDSWDTATHYVKVEDIEMGQMELF